MSELNYGNGFKLKGAVSTNATNGSTKNNSLTASRTDSVFYQDIAQSRYFTVSLDQIKDSKGKVITFKTPGGVWKEFLPVKNIGLNFTSYENLSVPFSVFSDLNLLNRKKITSITLNCYDTDKDIIERAVQAWERRCFPNDMYVQYIDEIKGILNYQSYDVKGNPSYNASFFVIPAGNVSVSRSYEENSEKLVSFSVAVIGYNGSSAKGKTYGEYGYGEGNSDVDILYERVLTGKVGDPNIK